MTQLSIGRRKAITGRLQGQAQLSAPISIPAPTGGLNRIDGITLMPNTDAIILRNMVSTRLGVSVRPGTITHASQIGGAGVYDTEVRTVAGFNNATALGGGDKLFAFTNQGIYDVTNSVVNPPLMDIYDGLGSNTVASTGWAVKGGDLAGWVSFVNFTNAVSLGGKHYLIACDLQNGYHIYDPDGGGPGIGRWYKVKIGNSGQAIEGIDPTLFVQVCSWKGRLIFAENNSSRAWYLTPGAVVGTGASKPIAIDMGSRFNAGGYLKGCYTWTYDGGAGIDDFLVAQSSAGDVVVWQGISPADTSFQIKGVWQIGAAPQGRRGADTFGGDLLIMGAMGLVPLSAIVAGHPDLQEASVTKKIQNLVREYFALTGQVFGWSITSHPSLGGIVLNAPKSVTGEHFQLFMSTQTSAWSALAGIPSLHWEHWQAKDWVGTDDGRVLLLIGHTDEVQLDDGTLETADISWQALTAYQSGDAPANWKRIHFIRPLFITEQLPVYKVEARYDFSLTIPQPVDPPPITAGARWDIALWDISSWGGGYVIEQPIIGASGIGRWFAVALSGKSRFETSLVGFDAIADIGGML